MTPSPLSLALASLLSLSACHLYFDGDDDPPPPYGLPDAALPTDAGLFFEDACGGGGFPDAALPDGPPSLDASGPPIPPYDAPPSLDASGPPIPPYDAPPSLDATTWPSPIDGGSLPSPPDGGY